VNGKATVTRGRWRPRLAAARVRAALRVRAAFRDRDRGASAVELAILAPALILVSLLIVQYAIWFDARHAALAAAQEGDLVAREDAATNSNGWQGLAVTAAENYYRGLDTSVISGLKAQTATGPDRTVSVTVSGKLTSIVPLTVSVTVSGPVECFRTQASQGTGCAP
jgi:Flp pilus assembly protein TadG